jgi:hypothetical protein
MAGNAELHPAIPDRIDIGIIQVFLTQMNEIATFLDGQFPVVVDDELAVMRKADFPRARISPRSSASSLSLMRICTS